MPKITYLIGAGASAEALPLVKTNLLNQMEGLPDAFRRVGNQIVDGNKEIKLKKNALNLKKGLYWLAE